jgi:hypothetical protein
MASRKEHNRECLEKLGNEWNCVNKWIDECGNKVNFEGVACLDINHHWYRHHKEGVEEVRKMWGEDAARAAKLHILRDMGKIYTKNQMIQLYGTVEKLVPWDQLFNN